MMVDEWKKDTGGADFLTEANFYDSIFSVADMWTDDMLAATYVGFLDELMEVVRGVGHEAAVLPFQQGSVLGVASGLLCRTALTPGARVARSPSPPRTRDTYVCAPSGYPPVILLWLTRGGCHGCAGSTIRSRHLPLLPPDMSKMIRRRSAPRKVKPHVAPAFNPWKEPQVHDREAEQHTKRTRDEVGSRTAPSRVSYATDTGNPVHVSGARAWVGNRHRL